MQKFKYAFLSLTFIFITNNNLNGFIIVNDTTHKVILIQCIDKETAESTFYCLDPDESINLDHLEQEENWEEDVIIQVFDCCKGRKKLNIPIQNKVVIVHQDRYGNIDVLIRNNYLSMLCSIL